MLLVYNEAMRKYLIKTIAVLFIGSALLSSACATPSSSEEKGGSSVPVLEPTEIVPMVDFASTMVRSMKTGWNLGNTFDATSNIDSFTTLNEGLSSLSCWGLPAPKKELFDALAARGFKTVRIPVSWSNHLVDKNYTIDPKWLEKLKTVVDWAIESGLVAIVNIHHDNSPSDFGSTYGRGFYLSNSSYAESEKFVVRVWEQVAGFFRDYSENSLVFETLNEPRMRKDIHEWNYVSSCSKCREAMNCLNNLNQKAVDTIRKSGGANGKRLIMVPSIAASPDAALADEFRLPRDPSNCLALATHAYAPYAFAMQKNREGGTAVFTASHKSDLDRMFTRLNEKFISKGVPVVMGEYGATNKNNLSAREEWFTYYLTVARQHNVCCILWDNNAPNNPDESERFGYINRATCEWYFPTLIDNIMKVYE